MASGLRRLADGHGIWTVLFNLRRVLQGYQPIFLDHPVEAVPRYGHGKPVHPEIAALLAAGDDRYAETLKGFLGFSDQLRRIPLRTERNSPEPSWINPWLFGLDTFALYGFISTQRPALLIEIGSGQSTKVARRAIQDHQLTTQLVSIDPQPRAEIDALCDKVVRTRLEQSDLSIFERLTAGDILFFDGSHRTFMNSDVTVFFLEVLPRLKPGVLVHIHDIFLPEDYLPWWQQAFYPHRYWSEQYVLAASLLAGHGNYVVVLPNHYVSIKPQLSRLIEGFWSETAMAGVERGGSSFWIRTR